MAGARVLLIDDDDTFALQLGIALRGAGDLRIVTNACAALRTARSWQPHVVLLDLLLPETDAFTLLEQLTAPDTAPECLVLCLTNGIGAATRVRPVTEWPVGTLHRQSSIAQIRATVLQIARALGDAVTGSRPGTGRLSCPGFPSP